MNSYLPAVNRYFVVLWLLFVPFACRTIAYQDANSFQRTAELKAKTLVLLDHATEDYARYVEKVDEISILAQELYAIQKARDLNAASIGQWKKLLEKDPVTGKSLLTDLLRMWKKNGRLSEAFVPEAKQQISEAFDEILKLESRKLKKP